MSEMSPYTQAAEAVDNHLSTSIEGLRQDMREGFSRVERRLDNMVTQDAFRSEVSRLDQADTHLEEKMNSGFETMESRMDSGFSSIETREEKRDAQAKARDEERDKRFARRMTWTISIVGLAFAIYQYVSVTYFIP